MLARASDAIGRPLEADEIKASLGRGVAIEITGVKLADDPAFSQLPFVQADEVLLKVEFLPLLSKELKVTELVLRQPQIRIIRSTAGAMNVSTIAKKSGENNLPKSGGGGSWWSGGGSGIGQCGRHWRRAKRAPGKHQDPYHRGRADLLSRSANRRRRP